MADAPVLLAAEELTVRFGGHVAVSEIDLQVRAGTVTGLIGPNGAGKTTTFNALCGLQNVSRGKVTLDGRDISSLSPHKRARLGLGRTFQRLETFSLLTVRENILAGAEFRQRKAGGRRGATAIADELIERLGLGDVADDRVDGLPTGRARLVEVGRALANGPRVLLLDEPSSGLNEAETGEFAVVLHQLTTDGLAVLLVEHDMSLVMSACQHIDVLDFGRIIASGDPATIQADEAVRAAYLGDQDEPAPNTPAGSATASIGTAGGGGELTEPEHEELVEAAIPVLEVRDLSAGYGDFDVIDGISFEIPAGEVFALLGPNGAGKTTTLQVIAGLLPASSGTVAVCGRGILGADADALARAGICMVPEGRGVFPNLSVAENLWMATHTGTRRHDVEEIAYQRFPRLGERRGQTAGTLSGGEQQMLAMARAMSTDPALLILDELSMGLAPIVVHELYERVAEIASTGISILVVEQFAHEVLGVADMAAIMLHGRIAKVGPPTEIAAELETAYLSGAMAPS
ncbi:ATP-binding cassette domain-containing protein [Aquihabitans sp. McL0605]|uniref:ATP-binding cassette domain-containing protein n=1 Tax=Aquihabitans sp. McL0605 TaxID=3415671 RepID=UPI003CEDC70B